MDIMFSNSIKTAQKYRESINRIDDSEDFNKAILVLLEVGIQNLMEI
jgi:hypothetical protein